VLAESTFHWLTTTDGVPAMITAQPMPTNPSPDRVSPRAVSHAESTASSACRSRSRISRASSIPSEAESAFTGRFGECRLYDPTDEDRGNSALEKFRAIETEAVKKAIAAKIARLVNPV